MTSADSGVVSGGVTGAVCVEYVLLGYGFVDGSGGDGTRGAMGVSGSRYGSRVGE
jgi:hypothetical protein